MAEVLDTLKDMFTAGLRRATRQRRESILPKPEARKPVPKRKNTEMAQPVNEKASTSPTTLFQPKSSHIDTSHINKSKAAASPQPRRSKRRKRLPRPDSVAKNMAIVEREEKRKHDSEVEASSRVAMDDVVVPADSPFQATYRRYYLNNPQDIADLKREMGIDIVLGLEMPFRDHIYIAKSQRLPDGHWAVFCDQDMYVTKDTILAEYTGDIITRHNITEDNTCYLFDHPQSGRMINAFERGNPIARSINHSFATIMAVAELHGRGKPKRQQRVVYIIPQGTILREHCEVTTTYGSTYDWSPLIGVMAVLNHRENALTFEDEIVKHINHFTIFNTTSTEKQVLLKLGYTPSCNIIFPTIPSPASHLPLVQLESDGAIRSSQPEITPLIFYVRCGNIKQVIQILQIKKKIGKHSIPAVDIDNVDTNGRNIIYHAFMSDLSDSDTRKLVIILLKANARRLIQDKYLNTDLHLVIKEVHNKPLALDNYISNCDHILSDSEAEYINHEDMNVLQYAIKVGNLQAIKSLIKYITRLNEERIVELLEYQKNEEEAFPLIKALQQTPSKELKMVVKLIKPYLALLSKLLQDKINLLLKQRLVVTTSQAQITRKLNCTTKPVLPPVPVSALPQPMIQAQRRRSHRSQAKEEHVTNVTVDDYKKRYTSTGSTRRERTERKNEAEIKKYVADSQKASQSVTSTHRSSTQFTPRNLRSSPRTTRSSRRM